MVLSLLSPASDEEASWNIENDDFAEAVEIIYWVLQDVAELNDHRQLVDLLANIDSSKFDQVEHLCTVYNNAVKLCHTRWKPTLTTKPPAFLNRRAGRDHLQFILSACYSHAVKRPELLNQYQPFSPSVYGESSFELVAEILADVGLASSDVFADLGSGVGQVVLQVAACTNVQLAFGVEYAPYPAECASRMGDVFIKLMDFFGKPYCPFKLHRGDFLDAQYEALFSQLNFVFVNNFAFGPEVDHKLKLRFANLKIGSKVVSSKPYRPLNFRITDRNLGDIASMMTVRVLKAIPDAVSWTHNALSYYLHVLDTTELETYFASVTKSRRKPINCNSAGNHHSNRALAPSSSAPCLTSAPPVSTANSTSSNVASTDDDGRPLPNLELAGPCQQALLLDQSRRRRRRVSRQLMARRRRQPRRLIVRLVNNNRRGEGAKNSNGKRNKKKRRMTRKTGAGLSTTTAEIARAAHTTALPESSLNGQPGSSTASALLSTNELSSAAVAPATETSVAQRRVIRQCRQPIVVATDNQQVDSSTATTTKSAKLVKHARCPAAAAVVVNLKRHRRQSVDQLYADTMKRLEVPCRRAPAAINDPAMRHHHQPELEASLKVKQLPDLTRQPTDQYIGHSNEPIPLAVEQYLAMMRNRLMSHVTQMRSPAYAQMLWMQLQAERQRSQRLEAEVCRVQQAITNAHVIGTNLLLHSMKRLGMSVNSPTDFFAQSRAIIKRHSELESTISSYQSMTSKLAAENRDLSRKLASSRPIPSPRPFSQKQASTLPPPPLLLPTNNNPNREYNLGDTSTGSYSDRQPPPLLLPPFLVRTAPPTAPPPQLLVAFSNESRPSNINSHSDDQLLMSHNSSEPATGQSRVVTRCLSPPTLSPIDTPPIVVESSRIGVGQPLHVLISSSVAQSETAGV